jgi:hypothetical protein
MNVVRSQIVCAVVVGVCLLSVFSFERCSLAGQPADAGVKAVCDTIAAKTVIAEDLIAGRLTLPVAIYDFRALDAKRPAHLPEVEGESVEQRYARYVIDWAQNLVQEESDGEAVSTRLEGELRQYLTATRDTEQ